MILEFTGSYRVVSRIPQYPFYLPPYYQKYSGDLTITKMEKGKYQILSLPYMDQPQEFKIGCEFREKLTTGEEFLTTFKIKSSDTLVQTAIDLETGRETMIERYFNKYPVIMRERCRQKQKITMRMVENKIQHPSLFFLDEL